MVRAKRRGPKNIDEYIAGFPPEVQVILEKIRMTIRRAAPDAEETISYQIPAFTLNGNLIYFAAYRKHFGLYPAPRGTAKFQKELSTYKVGKATIRLPLDKPIPFDLISKIVEFRVKEGRSKRGDRCPPARSRRSRQHYNEQRPRTTWDAGS